MERKSKFYKKVGKIDKKLSKNWGEEYYGNVYISKGAFNHIIKKHGKQLSKNVKNNLTIIIERIINSPDYVGKSTRRGKEALKLVKKIDSFIMVILEKDKEEGYIYVATFYPLTKSKLEAKIYSGSLKLINKNLEYNKKRDIIR